ncbi:DUF6768 family protein [Litorimonas sp. RW-G-Af-16]|uniref:DUF6768 family protein n=1 Tax=Litorimonas sp. RW-G-Af-16 TaxID=3241168 RepID=UPI00390CA1F5
MSNFDQKLQDLLSEEDEAYIDKAINNKGYYEEAFGSLKGQGSGLFMMTWGGIIIAGLALIYCIVRMFQATDLRQIILFATFAILLNSAQIALKLWFNMRLNRQALMREMKRLQLAIARD